MTDKHDTTHIPWETKPDTQTHKHTNTHTHAHLFVVVHKCTTARVNSQSAMWKANAIVTLLPTNGSAYHRLPRSQSTAEVTNNVACSLVFNISDIRTNSKHYLPLRTLVLGPRWLTHLRGKTGWGHGLGSTWVPRLYRCRTRNIRYKSRATSNKGNNTNHVGWECQKGRISETWSGKGQYSKTGESGDMASRRWTTTRHRSHPYSGTVQGRIQQVM